MNQHPPQLVGDSLDGNAGDLSGHGPKGRPRRGLDLELEPRRQPDGAEAAEPVFASAGHGVADGSSECDSSGRPGPPTKSITSPESGSMNIPLIVKSRRAASSSGEPKTTDSGRRPST